MEKTSFRQKIALIIFGIILSVVLLEVGLRIGGFIYLGLQERRNIVSMKQAGAYKIMCIGESTTALGGEDSYPSQLEELLNAQDTGINFSVINKGFGGTKTPLIIEELPDNLERYRPDMVISMMGINDCDDLTININHSEEQDFANLGKPSFFQSLRVYKLVSLLGDHIRSRIREVKVDRTAVHNKVSDDSQREREKTGGGMPAGEFSDSHQYYELGSSFREQGEYAKAAQMFDKFLESSPGDYQSYVQIGWYYKYHGEHSEAERVFKEAVAIDHSIPDAYIGLGWTYCHWWDRPGYMELAEDMFDKAIRADPKNADSYIQAAIFYLEPQRHDMITKLLKKAEKLDPDNIRIYTVLGTSYMAQGKYDLLEDIQDKVRSFSPKTTEDYRWLIESYSERQDYSDAEAVFEEAVNNGMADDSLYRMMRICFEMQKKYDLAAKYFYKERDSSLENYNAMTYYNYQRLKEITAEEGIKLICVQYPLRSIDILKAIVGNTEEVMLVDNQQLFEDALAEGAYQEYFTDIFGGNFGHCTRRGNRLLAGNVAKTVLDTLGIKYEERPDI